MKIEFKSRRIINCLSVSSYWTVTLFPGRWDTTLEKIEYEQEWRSGENTRLPPMLPGFKFWRWRHMWIEFVVGSLPSSERFFLRYSGFPLSLKTSTSKFQFNLERTDKFPRVFINS